MNSEILENKLEKKFHVSSLIILYKFAFGFLETLMGLGLLFANSTFMMWYINLARNELVEDPHGILIRLSQSLLPKVLENRHFLIIYLIAFGLVKVAGAIGLVYKKDWGVDLLVGLTALLLPFQIYRMIRHFSITESAYVLFGIIIVLFLINFKPRQYAKSLAEKLKSSPLRLFS